MKRSGITIALLLLTLFSGYVHGDPKGILDRPIMQGPQYSLAYMGTLFEPDTAFLLPPGELFIQVSYSLLNAWGYSENAYRDDSGVRFRQRDSDGYSVYFDSELDRRLMRLFYGLGKNFELQLTYRDIRFADRSFVIGTVSGIRAMG